MTRCTGAGLYCTSLTYGQDDLSLAFRGAVAILVLFVAIVLWETFLFPTSVNEFLFRHRLKETSGNEAKEIRVAGLARFDWEEVCFLHPYSGDLRYEKYNRVYRGKGHSEGDETILFIKQDSSPTYFIYAAGMTGVEIIHERRMCWPRNEAIMIQVPDSRPRYTMTGDIPYIPARKN